MELTNETLKDITNAKDVDQLNLFILNLGDKIKEVENKKNKKDEEINQKETS